VEVSNQSVIASSPPFVSFHGLQQLFNTRVTAVVSRAGRAFDWASMMVLFVDYALHRAPPTIPSRGLTKEAQDVFKLKLTASGLNLKFILVDIA